MRTVQTRSYWGVVGLGAAGLGADGADGTVAPPAAGVVGAGTPDFTL